MDLGGTATVVQTVVQVDWNFQTNSTKEIPQNTTDRQKKGFPLSQVKDSTQPVLVYEQVLLQPGVFVQTVRVKRCKTPTM